MATQEVHELAVAVKPEGISSTTDELNELEGQFDETADSVGDSADEMAGFSRKWAGAMLAITGGFSVAAGTLLSRVPVIGDAMAGLDSSLTSLALAIDEDIRPSVSDLSDDFFELSKDIDEADSSAEAFGRFIRGLGDISVDIVLGVRAPETGDSKLSEFEETMDEFFTGLVGRPEADIDLSFDLPSLSSLQERIDNFLGSLSIPSFDLGFGLPGDDDDSGGGSQGRFQDPSHSTSTDVGTNPFGGGAGPNRTIGGPTSRTGFDEGGLVPETGLALVHEGEFVEPAPGSEPGRGHAFAGRQELRAEIILPGVGKIAEAVSEVQNTGVEGRGRGA